jgi:hypothetical protein
MAGIVPDDPTQARGQHGVTTQPRPATTTTTRPHVWELILHPLKTLRFVGALARDPRLSPLVKVLCLLIVAMLLAAVLIPEGVIATLVAALLPIVGPIVAVPADATVDWLLLGTMAYALLALFPAHIVREHHARIFHPRRRPRR